MMTEQEQRELEKALRGFYDERDKVKQAKIDDVLHDFTNLSVKVTTLSWELSDLLKKVTNAINGGYEKMTNEQITRRLKMAILTSENMSKEIMETES